MGLRDSMAADLQQALLSPDDLGDVVTLVPADTAPLGLPVTVVFGDARQLFAVEQLGPQDDRRATASGSRALMRQAIWQLTAVARDPDRQDTLVVPVGNAYEGTWTIERSSPDDGDGMLLEIRQDRPYAVSTDGVRTG
jgi:hypothetical protein